jgi:hypothetical protein
VEKKKSYSEDLNNYYFSLNYIGNIISNRMSCGAGSMRVMRLYMPTNFLLVILQRTSRCVYELTTNLYRSVKHNHLFQSRMTIYFCLKRPLCGNQYKNFKISYSTVQIASTRWRSWLKALRYKPEGRGFDSRWCHWNFFVDIILPAALWPMGVDSASNRN